MVPFKMLEPIRTLGHVSTSANWRTICTFPTLIVGEFFAKSSHFFWEYPPPPRASNLETPTQFNLGNKETRQRK
jgi:hypothetical protein